MEDENNGVEVLAVVEGNPLLTEILDQVAEAASVWTSFDVWFDPEERAIVGRKRQRSGQSSDCRCIVGTQLPRSSGPCPFCEERVALQANGEVSK